MKYVNTKILLQVEYCFEFSTEMVVFLKYLIKSINKLKIRKEINLMIFGLIHKIVITKPNTLKMIRSLDSNYDIYIHIYDEP